MRISIIVAMDEGRLIGNEGGMPWHLPADLKFFKSVTMGKPVIMGRSTWESIGKVLPGRTNIVITRNTTLQAEGCQLAHSVDEALAIAKKEAAEEVIIIGGGGIYEQTLNRVDRLYLTQIAAHLVGDTHFPVINPDEWQEVSRQEHKADGDNPFDLTFVVLDRKKAGERRKE
ncbi:dihydrofolate reductase type 3 [bacterium BMS3Bbin11]|nr:dihydrofolate reductase type 3 [bacterium BMS3Bbin11]HDH08371.1 type 3 dihydrofolate reductase [Gammaproteobacteria bacterium]